MKEITLQDCENLRNKFDQYLETAEQHEFIKLYMVDVKFTQTLNDYKKAGKVTDQRNANAMFRVVLKMIGEDASEYTE